MVIKDEIGKRINDFIILCSTHKVKYVYAFGSSVNGNFDYSKSDIDLRRVDMLTDSSIRNPYLRKSIESTKVLIYDGAGQKVLI